MKTIIALYRGETIGSARLVAVSVDPQIITILTKVLLSSQRGEAGSEPCDPVVAEVEAGRRRALRRIQREAREAEAGHPAIRVLDGRTLAAGQGVERPP